LLRCWITDVVICRCFGYRHNDSSLTRIPAQEIERGP
jgi:hypothetical protein